MLPRVDAPLRAFARGRESFLYTVPVNYFEVNMKRYLIERALSNEALAVVPAEDEIQAFERLLLLQDLLGVGIAESEHFNVRECLPGEPVPPAPAFSEGYFELQTRGAHYTMQ